MNKYSQKSAVGRVSTYISKNHLICSGDHIVVAISGGADSVCLLSILFELRDKLGIELSACHFDHRLRGAESEADQKFVQELCKRRGIELALGQAPDKNLYKSEDSARQARYAFFEKILEESRGAKIALAHNLNDQAETVLLRLIRGTGIRGLRAISPQRQNFIRPLLPLSRMEIEDYLKKRNIKFRTDRSNADTALLRNQIRHNILPILAKSNPRIVETLNTLAQQSRTDYDYLDNQATKALQKIIITQTSDHIILDYSKWLKLDPAIVRLCLRLSLERIDSLVDITAKQIDDAVMMLKNGVGGKHKILPRSLRIELAGGKIKIVKHK